AVAVTMPPWSGPHEALLVDGAWPVPAEDRVVSAPTLRAGGPADADALTSLAFRSKAFWRYDNAFMEACRDELCVAPALLRDGLVQLLELDGQIVGFAGIEPLADGVWDLSHLFVAPDRVGHGHGARLFQAVLLQLRANGARRLAVQADPQAGPFYARMGGRPTGTAPSRSIPGRQLPCYEFVVEGASA
ncbi:MAG: GNAT family N-acetyltransferase, partial [Pseudomonadota bacterium]